MHVRQHTSASQVSKLRSLVSLGGRHLCLPSPVTKPWLLGSFLYIFLSSLQKSLCSERGNIFYHSPKVTLHSGSTKSWIFIKSKRGVMISSGPLPASGCTNKSLGPHRQKRTLGSWSLLRLWAKERRLMRNMSDCSQGRASCHCVRLRWTQEAAISGITTSSSPSCVRCYHRCLQMRKIEYRQVNQRLQVQ